MGNEGKAVICFCVWITINNGEEVNEDMRAMISNFTLKLMGVAAALATLVAVSNVHSTCIFLAYQPDVPEELK